MQGSVGGGFVSDMLDLCEASYDPASWATLSVAERASVPRTFHDFNSGAAVLISRDYASCNNATLVAFRGTDDFLDVLHDVMVFRACTSEKGERFRLHAGFLAQYNSVKDFVPIDDSPKIFVGHSSGGAQAAIAAAMYPRREDVSCVTFGAPRVGDEAFAGLFDREVGGFVRMRVRDPADVVTFLPTAWWGYRHAPIDEYDLFPGENWCRRFIRALGWTHGLRSYRAALANR